MIINNSGLLFWATLYILHSPLLCHWIVPSPCMKRRPLLLSTAQIYPDVFSLVDALETNVFSSILTNSNAFCTIYYN